MGERRGRRDHALVDQALRPRVEFVAVDAVDPDARVARQVQQLVEHGRVAAADGDRDAVHRTPGTQQLTDRVEPDDDAVRHR